MRNYKDFLKLAQAKNVSENNILRFAIQNSASVQEIRDLISDGIQVNAVDDSGKWSALIATIAQSNLSDADRVEIASILIDAGADVSYQSSTFSALSLCASYGQRQLAGETSYLEIGCMLIERANELLIDLTETNCDSSMSPLAFAIKSEFFEMADRIIEHQRDINFVYHDNCTAFEHITKEINQLLKNKNVQAINDKCERMLEYLISNGADCKRKNKNGQSVLDYVEDKTASMILHLHSIHSAMPEKTVLSGSISATAGIKVRL